MQKRLKKIGVGLVAVGLSIVLLLTAAMPICEAGPGQEKVVKIGNLAVLTGPLASTGIPANYGFFDGIRYLNEKGGIDGVKVKCMWEDVQYSISKMITAHKRLKAAGEMLEFSITSTLWEAMPGKYVEDEIPCLGFSPITAALLTEPPWFFTGLPGWPELFETTMKFFNDIWTEERPLRMGGICYEHPLPRSAFDTGFEFAPKYGVDYVGYEVIPAFGAIDTTTEWLRLAGKKPDYVFLIVYGGSLVTVTKDYARLNIRQKGVEYVGAPATVDEQILNIVRQSGEGCLVVQAISRYHLEELGGAAPLLEAAEKYRGWGYDRISINYIYGWFFAHILFEGVTLAIEEVGFENLTGRAIRNGLANIRDFDFGFAPFIPPFTISDDFPHLLRTLRLFKVQQGEMVAVSDHFPSCVDLVL